MVEEILGTNWIKLEWLYQLAGVRPQMSPYLPLWSKVRINKQRLCRPQTAHANSSLMDLSALTLSELIIAKMFVLNCPSHYHVGSHGRDE